MEGGLEGVLDREVGRVRIAGDVGIPLLVHCYALTILVVGTAEVGGIEQVRARRIEFAHEGIVIPMVGGLERLLDREVGRGGSADDVGIPLLIHGYTIAKVVAGTAKKGR